MAAMGARCLLLGLVLAWPVLGTAAQPRDPDPELLKAVEEAVEATDSFENRFDAEVWLTDMSGRLASRIPQPDRRLRFLRVLHYEATRADLKPELVLAVIDVESDFNRFALSDAGARGYMQIMPFWLEEIGRPNDNLFNTPTNLRMGCTILGYYLERENGNLTKALARYNGSVGETWYPELVFEALREHWYQH
jgi:soluble lytic murein transglycosylase-like protein